MSSMSLYNQFGAPVKCLSVAEIADPFGCTGWSGAIFVFVLLSALQ
jgi:hypothetical protein